MWRDNRVGCFTSCMYTQYMYYKYNFANDHMSAFKQIYYAKVSSSQSSFWGDVVCFWGRGE